MSAYTSAAAGLSVYEAFGCATCHKLKGCGGTFRPALDGVADKYTAESLPPFLRNPTRDTMPKFEGTDAEINSLVQFLLSNDK
ncbi:MAG: cytochrome c [Planctomycetota bacterium]